MISYQSRINHVVTIVPVMQRGKKQTISNSRAAVFSYEKEKITEKSGRKKDHEINILLLIMITRT